VGKGKIGKSFPRSLNFFGNRVEIWKRGEMHQWLRGMDAPNALDSYTSIHPSIHLSIQPSFHPSIHSSIHPFIHQPCTSRTNLHFWKFW